MSDKAIFESLKESYSIEMKSSVKKLSDDFWPTYSSFCNCNGGTVYLGIKEGKEKNFLIGVDDPYKIRTNLFNDLNNESTVSYNGGISNSDFKIHIIDETTKIIEIHISEAPLSKKPVYLKGNPSKTYLRTSDGDRIASKEQLISMFRNATGNLDGELLSNFSIDDLDEETINKFKTMVLKRHPDKSYLQKDNSEFLLSIGALKKDRSEESQKIKLTSAALLFFGKYNAILEKFPHYHLDYFNKSDLSNKRWSDRVASDEPSDIEMNLFNFFTITFEKLKLTVENSFELNDKLERQSIDPILIALREAIVNCLMHADYYSDTCTIKIEVHDGWYSFTNPGIMKISLNEFICGGNSSPRNNIITQFFRLMGLSERAGTGGPQIYGFAYEKKYRLPELETDLNKTTLRIWKEDFISSIEGLSENEKIVLTYIKDSISPVSYKEIESNTKLTEFKIRSSISSLLEKDLISKEGNSRATKYHINLSSKQIITQFNQILSYLQHNFQL